MHLQQLLTSASISGAHAVGNDPTEIDITHIAENSRVAQPGTLFVAVKGSVHDGHKFIGDALGRGVQVGRGRRGELERAARAVARRARLERRTPAVGCR